jgi:isocitrate dehydrogenase kinase/phosphatase
VQFLRSLMPRKPRAELYNAMGLQKHGKNLFYRDFLATTSATAATSSASRRASRAW